MTDIDGLNTSAMQDSTEAKNGKKVRGRIQNAEWGYVLYQYKNNKRTYEEIGDEFGCTPSAVFYVVKQAELRGVEPVAERPVISANEGARAINRISQNSQWAANKVRAAVANEQPAAPARPSQVDMMAEKAKAMLEDEVAQRVFDRMSKLLISWNDFKSEPTAASKQVVKDSVKEALRAASAMELKVELTPVNQQQPAAQQSNIRLPELA